MNTIHHNSTIAGILIKRMLRKGRAQIGDTLRVHFICKHEDGTILDFSLGREPFQFTIGKSQVMQGLEQAVIGMSPEDCKSVKIPTDKTFGPLAGKNLIFDILLLGFPDPKATGHNNLTIPRNMTILSSCRMPMRLSNYPIKWASIS